MRRITQAELMQEFAWQGVEREHLAFVCPMCGFVQSARSFIEAGAGKSVDDVTRFLGFSCVGRVTGAISPRKKHDGKPCNWTLGGLFKMHKLEIVMPDGKAHPAFELATAEQAQALRDSWENEGVKS